MEGKTDVIVYLPVACYLSVTSPVALARLRPDVTSF